MSAPNDLLAPYGRAWERVIDAFQKKVDTLDEAQLTELIVACHEGRYAQALSPMSYGASFEVERIARQRRTQLRHLAKGEQK